MTRQNEIGCLETLKNALLGKTNISIYSNCDLKSFSLYVFSAKQNMNSNVFPDFIFNGGGIEHFQLTSSKETRKGSAFKIEENANKQIRDEYHSKLEHSYLKSDSAPGTITTSNYEEIYESFSYEDFLRSFERNVVSHVESLEKNNYQNKIVVFLMEQQTARLWIDEGVVPIKFYELHKDKRALSLVKDFCKHVKYVVYCVSDSIEVLDLSKINELLDNSITYKNVKGGRLIRHQIDFLIDL